MTTTCTDPEHLADLGRCPGCHSIDPAVRGFLDDGSALWAICDPCDVRWIVAGWARSATEWAYAEMDAAYSARCAANRERLSGFPIYSKGVG